MNSTPFDQNTFSGFAGVLTLELFGGGMFLTVTTMISSLFLSMGLYFGAFCAHFELMFQNISEMKSENESISLMKTRLIIAVRFHNHAKG